MPVILGWDQIAIRLACTVVAGALVGFNRERGHAAGLRTTLLVCLAASVAMLQANLLMNTTGKAANSFVVLDLMRLPLGILSGMGFIGAGAILRRGNRIVGVTTAATLWFVTVLGLCFGGGQIALGAAGLVIGLLVLWGLKRVEETMTRRQFATLVLLATSDGPDDQAIRLAVQAGGFSIRGWEILDDAERQRRKLTCHLSWWAAPGETRPPPLLQQLARQPGVLRLKWNRSNL